MSELRNKQHLHVSYVASLLIWGKAHGYKFTWGETLRTPEQAMHNAAVGAGISHSLHLIKLAVDLNAWKDGIQCLTVEDFRELGECWKSFDPLCCWGGDFHSPDADHFSITWQGVK